MRLAAIGQALFRSYGRCFAEFLNEGSLVHLTPSAGPLTCVGLRYGFLLTRARALFLAQRVPESNQPKLHLPSIPLA